MRLRQPGEVDETMAPARVSAADRFAGLCAMVISMLPWGLSRIIPPSLLGFALINGCTFALDLGLLSLFHGSFGIDVPVAYGAAYIIAFAVAFVLNRHFNFRSHAPLGTQTAIYAVVVAINFFGLIVGLATGLAHLGVNFLLARLIAGVCEAAFMYCSMRWIVFRR